MHTKTATTDAREPEPDAGVGLSDEALDHVVGGLNRAWTSFVPFSGQHNGVGSAAPRHDLDGGVDAKGHKP